MSWILLFLGSLVWVWLRPEIIPKDFVEIWICVILDIITFIPALIIMLIKKALF